MIIAKFSSIRRDAARRLLSGAAPQGGHVHPTFLRIDFHIRLNSMKEGGSFFLPNIKVATRSPRLQFSHSHLVFVAYSEREVNRAVFSNDGKMHKNI